MAKVIGSLILVVIGVFLIHAAFGGGASAHTINGSVLIYKPGNMTHNGTACTGVGDLGTVQTGNPVRITTANGKEYWGKIGDGSITSEGNCRIPFTVKNVPESDTYTFEVGGQPARTVNASVVKARKYQPTLDWDCC